MRLTLIALLLAGVVGCDPTPEELALELDATLKAAEQGDAEAQFNLGLMYETGRGVPENNVEAYALMSVAATNGQEEAKERLPKVKAKLTPEQLVAAQQRATELFEQINANKAD